MDIITILFVGGLCVVAFLLTARVRRELIAKERQGREERRQLRARPRRKP